MAKRKKLEAPSAEDLHRYEAEFRREVPRGPLTAPIAQVAADSAAAQDARPPEARAEAARDRAEAEAFRAAQERGLVLTEIALEDIDADVLVRDRVVLDAAEMEELKGSIARSGLRLPVEVFEIDGGATDGAGGARYGLLSGYRRLKAFRDLKALTGQAKYDRIPAAIRAPETMGGPFAAMVEENEIRASLSLYERGRIAVIAAQQGAFVNTEAAVEALFPMASKAKRSKVRSFALIFEELGDMLTFPDLIRERDGLKIATALRAGGEATLRQALAESVPETPADEAALLAEALQALEPPKPDKARGGRPRKQPQGGPARHLDSGVSLQPVHDGQGWAIRLTGARVDRELVEVAMGELERLLQAP